MPERPSGPEGVPEAVHGPIAFPLPLRAAGAPRHQCEVEVDRGDDESPVFIEEFQKGVPEYMLRHKVKAGIIGWPQANGWRGDTSIEKRIQYDLEYIENWPLLPDLKILFRTLYQGFVHKHAD